MVIVVNFFMRGDTLVDLASFNIDIEELLKDLRLYWLERDESRYNDTALTKIKKSGENIMFCCPHHHESNPSCGIQVDYPYGYNCFSCGASGNLPQLVAHVVGLPSEAHGIHFLMKHYVLVNPQERPPLNIEEILDGKEGRGLNLISEEEIKKYTRKRHPYIKKRGFSERTLRKYEVGYDEVQRAITFPVRASDGTVRFIKRRSVDRKNFLNQAGIRKKDIIYGLYYLLQSPRKFTELYLTESETDTLACYEAKMPSGAILGRILFKEQVKELIKAGIKTVILFFDNDQHGIEATFQAYQLLSRMSPIRVKAVLYPNGQYGLDGLGVMKYKDANDLLLAKKLDKIKKVTFAEYYMLYKNAGQLDISI